MSLQSALAPAADQAQRIHEMLAVMLWVCGIMYLLVIGFLAWALWRARRRLAPDPPQAEAKDPGLERALGGWVALIVVGLLGLTTMSFLIDRSLAAAGPSPLKIRITAQQWWWNVEYQDPDISQRFATANELHLPSGRTAEIELKSQDVIHSFWVPNLHGKEDLAPGRTNHILITPRRTGRFRGQCAEFCGLQHAQMALDVTVDDPGRFEGWRQAQLRTAPEPTAAGAARGKQVFLSGPCALCHAIQGTEAASHAGPDLTHVASRPSLAAGTLPYTRANLAGWIADPQGIKPGSNMPASNLSGEDLVAVVDYLDSLK